jgi:hypothetical protein
VRVRRGDTEDDRRSRGARGNEYAAVVGRLRTCTRAHNTHMHTRAPTRHTAGHNNAGKPHNDVRRQRLRADAGLRRHIRAWTGRRVRVVEKRVRVPNQVATRETDRQTHMHRTA